VTKPGMLSHGMPPVPDDLARRVRELERQNTQMQSMIVHANNAATAAGLVAVSVTKDVNSTTFPNDAAWHTYATTATQTVPAGFTRMLISMWAAVGGTFSGATGGFLGVAPQVDGYGVSAGQTSGRGEAGPFSVSMPFSMDINSLTPGTTFTLSAQAILSGAVTAGSNNVHLSALIIYLRG